MALNPQYSTELAIDRTPVEIWSRILALAISCPLLPIDDDGLVVNLYLLQYDYEAIVTYWDSERFRLACRLVCKAWKSLLDRYAHRLFLPLSWFSGFPLCQRIQHPPDPLQWTPCDNHDTLYTRHSDPSIIVNKDRNSILAFVDQISSSRRRVVDFVTRFSGLRILAVRAFDELKKCPISLPTLSSKCTSLTHLALYLLYQAVPGESQVLVLPNLHTLFLHIVADPTAEIRPIPLSKWKLPKLRNLGVRAHLRVGKENYEEFQILVKNVGGHLHGLSFSWRCAGDEEIILDQLWEWCPRLQYLEISNKSILALWPPPDTHATLVIIFMDIKETSFSDSYLVPYARLVTHILLSQTTTAKVYSFGIPISWATLRRNFKYAGLSFIRPILQLFECFQTRGYSFIDRYGVPLEAGEAQMVMRWLRKKSSTVVPSAVHRVEEAKGLGSWRKKKFGTVVPDV